MNPIDLARRSAAVSPLERAEADHLRCAWDDSFGRSVLECTGKPVYGGFRWHAFSWGFVPAESGARAVELYLEEQSAEWIALPEDEDQPAFRIAACSPIDFGECDRDLYLVPATFAWTMVFTHEQPSIGPFFSRTASRDVEPHRVRTGPPINRRYFACVDHREYVDAGYRWAYWMLEDAGIAQLDEELDLARLLTADEYWSPPADERSSWLSADILPGARSFLGRHAGHHLVYLEEDRLDIGAEQGHEWREAD